MSDMGRFMGLNRGTRVLDSEKSEVFDAFSANAEVRDGPAFCGDGGRHLLGAEYGGTSCPSAGEAIDDGEFAGKRFGPNFAC